MDRWILKKIKIRKGCKGRRAMSKPGCEFSIWMGFVLGNFDGKIVLTLFFPKRKDAVNT